jgi:hypothetical protein
MKARKKLISQGVPVALIVVGCMLAPHTFAQQKKDSFRVSFTYGIKGLSGGSTFDRVVLVKGMEARDATIALIRAVQDLDFSIVGADPSDPLSQGGDHNTDIVPIPDSILAEYQGSKDAIAVPNDRRYGLQYTLNYKVEGKALEFNVKAILFQRGSASAEWMLYRPPYSSKYFYDRLHAKILDELGRLNR